ncbi:hypothetical protein JXO59_04560 [candidate division KSB1 bacterium]|nr:hypothetical protein [candidate division KSB1 bacterium]
MRRSGIKLPEHIGVWTRDDSVRRIDAGSIFDYMNGAGELYLGYRFEHLEVVEYRAENEYDILVEIYHLNSPDDAFGLLSLDWSGESIFWGDIHENREEAAARAYPIALYGAGLLRLRAGSVYARIMAYRETPAAKQVIFALGEIISAGHPLAPAPEIIHLISIPDASSWQGWWQAHHFLRSHLVLNSLYYLSHVNILSLDHDVEAVLTRFSRTGEGEHKEEVTAFIIAYPSAEKAGEGLLGFYRHYLLDHESETLPPSEVDTFYQLEEGWAGGGRRGRFLLLILNANSRLGAKEVLDLIDGNITQGGMQ